MKSITIDTNLLILLVVGLASIEFIALHKRTRQYTMGDYLLLRRFVGKADALLLTTHVLTETSNLLLRGCRADLAEPIARELARIIEAGSEEGLRARHLVRSPLFPRLGLTDAGLVELAGRGTLVLTADLDLYLAAAARNHATINFAHVQEASHA